MFKSYYTWRYFSLGKEHYYECINNIFLSNLRGLCQANILTAVFAVCYSIVSIAIERDITKAIICLAAAVIAVILAIYTNYKMQTQFMNSRFVYTLTILYYVNLMIFGIYLNVWSSPGRPATIFLCFLICALLMVINSPLFNLCLTSGAMICFIVSTIIIKTHDYWIWDVVNSIVACILSLYFSWQINKLRLGLELSTTMLENERNTYFDQSIIDELTQLKNRRDFQQTFKRYLSNFRTTDKWLCIAVLDIDYFKYYNDHYGHPEGDECLRAVGRVLNSLKDIFDVYSARVGGEEFALLWFESDASHVDTVIVKLQELIRELQIPHEESTVSPFVTLSMGVFIEPCGSSNDTHTLYDKADKALYIAKEDGRNQAVIYGDTIEQYKIRPVNS